jgi:hypothetical protein
MAGQLMPVRALLHRVGSAEGRPPGEGQHERALDVAVGMDVSSRTALLCRAGTSAEFERRLSDARDPLRQAWKAAVDDHDAAMVAHCIGNPAPDVAEAHRRNLAALEHAGRDERAEAFGGSR